MVKIISRSSEATIALAKMFAAVVRPGDNIHLQGDLGAGKTTFVRGLAEGSGFSGTVTSPTFTLVHEYVASVTLFHIDCFRLRTDAEKQSIDFNQYLRNDAITIIEWPELVESYLPRPTWSCGLQFIDHDENSRSIQFHSVYEDLLSRFIQQIRSLPGIVL